MPYTLSSFQQVFHEIKDENPTAPIGAVQQMTMRRLSEIQQIEKEEQDRLRSLADRDNEEKMSVAARALHKFVDVIRVTAPDEVEAQRNTATSLSTSDRRQSFDSFVKKVSAQRRGSHNSIFSDFNASNDSLFGGCTPARTANEMYAIAAEEQGDNMALRKSIGDFTAMLSVGDMSNRSNGSLRSELSGLLLEELAQTAQDEPSPGHTESMNVGSSQDDNFDTGLFAAYTLQIGESTNCSVSADAEGLYAEMDDYQFTTTAQSEKEATRIDSSDDPSKNDNFYLNDSRHSIAKSVLSALSSCPSVCSDGLIVGFRPRPLDTELEVNQDEDHLNSGNFASDFSAWEN